jgi:hypothetical protein
MLGLGSYFILLSRFMSPRIRSIVAAIVTFLFGYTLALNAPWAGAAVGDGTGSISACRNNLTGTLRQITSGSCTALTETAVSWRQGPEAGTEFPFVCVNCALYNQSMFAGRDFTGALLTGVDFTNDPLNNANFTQAQITNSRFTNTTLTGANFTNDILTGVDFTNATGLDSAILTGVDWDSTTCPDGTNSDDNDDTCSGHLTP